MQHSITQNHPQKNIFHTNLMFVLLVTALFFSAGCDTVIEEPVGELSARIDSENWIADEANVIVPSSDYYVMDAVSHDPSGNSTGSVSLNFYATTTGSSAIGDKNYSINASGNTITVINSALIMADGAGLFANDIQGGGSVTVTELSDRRIVGTFSFTVPTENGTLVVNSGKFDMPLDAR